MSAGAWVGVGGGALSELVGCRCRQAGLSPKTGSHCGNHWPIPGGHRQVTDVTDFGDIGDSA
eukprot:4131170-Pyramimonas_sp.AAC.1